MYPITKCPESLDLTSNGKLVHKQEGGVRALPSPPDF
jgi:hypothetical protein